MTIKVYNGKKKEIAKATSSFYYFVKMTFTEPFENVTFVFNPS